MNYQQLQTKTFLLFLVTVSAAFVWLLLPFYGAVFWGTVLAILFMPLYRRIVAALRGRQNLAAATTLLLILILVIFPLAVLTASLIREGTALVELIRSPEMSLSYYLQQLINIMPGWMLNLIDRLGFTDTPAVLKKLSEALGQGAQFIVSRAVNLGQLTFDFLLGFTIMLYLLFFLLRDGTHLFERIRQTLPFNPHHQRHLFTKFATVIRATVKGNIVVAATQGALGGLIFWILDVRAAVLWGVVMAFLSLLPAVGAALIWAPVAIYLLATGAVVKGVVLIAFGVLVIGLIDNLLRPILVGKDTQMPDYVVLISTLGGLALFGLTGFVIGPVIAALFISTWDLFYIEKQNQ